jgi:nitrite reductase (NADH) small subunit
MSAAVNGIGRVPPARAAARFDLGSVDQIPLGEGRAFSVGGRRIAVFRTRDGRIFATQAECPHRGGPLADGLVGSATVVCPLHEWRFDLVTGATPNGACAIAVYPLSVDAAGQLALELPP